MNSATYKCRCSRPMGRYDSECSGCFAAKVFGIPTLVDTDDGPVDLRELDAALDAALAEPRSPASWGCGKKHLGCHCDLCRKALAAPDDGPEAA